MDSGRVRHTFHAPQAGILGIRFREGSRVVRLVAKAPVQRQVVDVDVSTGRVLSSRSISLTSAPDYLGTTALSSDGHLLVVAGPAAPDSTGKTIATLWDLDGDREAFRLYGQPGGSPPSTASFSANDKLLALGFDDGKVEIWDLTSRRLRASTRVHSTGFGVEKSGLTFTPDGSILASTGRMNRLVLSMNLVDAFAAHLSGNGDPDEQFEVVLIDTSDGHSSRVAKDFSGVEFSPDGRSLATGHEDGAVWIHDAPASR